MILPEDLSQDFEREMSTLEEGLKMPFITSVERIAEARGEARGEAKGGAAVLLKQLKRICDTVPEELEQRIRHLPFERLEAMGEAIFDFHALKDVQAWLDAHR